MSYNDAYYGANDGFYNSQPDPSAAAYVPGAQQQNLVVHPATGYPYPGWQQQQPYFGPGPLGFNVAPPPFAPAGVYGYQPQVPAYNGPAYTGPLDVLAPPPPAHQAYYADIPPAVRAAYNNPTYPDAANFFAQHPPVAAYDGPVYSVGAQQQMDVVAPQLPYQIDLAQLTPAFIARVAQGDPALALALQAYALRHAVPELEPEAEPALEFQEVESEPEPEPEPEFETEPESEAEVDDEPDTPVHAAPAPPPASAAAILGRFYHGMDEAEARALSALVYFPLCKDGSGRRECPVAGCRKPYVGQEEALRHLVDSSMVCPICGRTLSRHDAYQIRRHEGTKVCMAARRAAEAAGRR